MDKPLSAQELKDLLEKQRLEAEEYDRNFSVNWVIEKIKDWGGAITICDRDIWFYNDLTMHLTDETKSKLLELGYKIEEYDEEIDINKGEYDNVWVDKTHKYLGIFKYTTKALDVVPKNPCYKPIRYIKISI